MSQRQVSFRLKVGQGGNGVGERLREGATTANYLAYHGVFLNTRFGRGKSKMHFLGIVVLCTALAGCAESRRSTQWDTIRQVKVGTTQTDLLTIMGKPDVVKSRDGQETWVWSNPYAVAGTARMVSFGLRDGKVSEIPNVAPLE
jgi:hypothetical protein